MIKPIVLLIVCLLTFTLSNAQDREALEQRKKKLNEEIEMLNNNIQKMSNDKNSTLKQLEAISAQLKLREQKVKLVNQELSLIDKAIKDKNDEIIELQKSLKQLKKDYAATIKIAYRNRSSNARLMYIFAANDFNVAFRRMQYLKQFNENRRNQFIDLEKTQKRLSSSIVELDKIKQEKGSTLNAQKEELSTISKEKQQQETIVQQLAREEKQMGSELKKKQRESKRVDKMIQDAIKKEIEYAKKKDEEEARKRAMKEKDGNKKTPILTSTPEVAALSSDFLSNKGSLPWPVLNGVLTQGMGKAKVEKNVTVQIDGILIQTNPGATVRSVFDGEVVRVLDLGASVAVLIRHGEYFTVYANMRSATVQKGDKVKLKQTIGKLPGGENDAVPELKFGLWKGSTPQNPEFWLAK